MKPAVVQRPEEKAQTVIGEAQAHADEMLRHSEPAAEVPVQVVSASPPAAGGPNFPDRDKPGSFFCLRFYPAPERKT